MTLKNNMSLLIWPKSLTLAFVILFCTAENVLALGLGSADVKSHLGEYLRASIPITGASEIIGLGCFSVLANESDPNQLNTANLSLSEISADQAILSVKSYQVMNEPIVNLAIQAGCGANVRRDYVILLDPPSSEPIPQFAPIVLNNESGVDKSDTIVNFSSKSSKKTEQVEPQVFYANDEAPNKKRNKSKKSQQQNNALPPNDVSIGAGKGVNQKATQADNAALKLTPKIDATFTQNALANQPRLSVSGGNSAYAKAGALSLDKQLHFTPETAPLALDAEIAVLDEATVLTNRLLHLEKQLNVLSLSNKKLKAENATMAAELSEAKTWNNRFDWLGYIIGGGLLMTSIVLADKWRRQRQIDALEYAELSMQNMPAIEENQDLFNKPLDIQNAAEIDSFMGSTPDPDAEMPLPAVAFNDEPGQSPFLIEEYNEADHNILDHADVFLSHGRTSLAIQLLQNHLLEHPKQSVTVWMFLLDLLSKEHMQAAYEQTAQECKEHFNVRIADYNDDESTERHSFEDYPRLISGLEQAWGTPAALSYLEELVYNSRLETRVGFEKNVIDELLLLRDIVKDTLNVPPILVLDENKQAIKMQKAAQLAAKKAEKVQQLNEEAAVEEAKIKAAQAAEKKEKKEVLFEFSLIEYDKNS